MVQTSVMVDGQWVNLNDVQDQQNMKEDLHTTAKVVGEQQKQITVAENNASDAVAKAEAAVTASKVNGEAIKAQTEGLSAAASALEQTKTSLVANRADLDSYASMATAQGHDIAALQSTDKTISSALADTNGNVSKAQQTADSLAHTVQDQAGRISTVEQAASHNTVAIGDTAGNLTRTNQTVSALQGSITNAKQDITNLQATATGIQATVADAKQNLTNVTAAVDGLQTTVRNNQNNVENRFTQLADTTQSTIRAAMADAQGATEVGGRIDLNTMIKPGKYLLTGELIHSPFKEVVDPPDPPATSSAAPSASNSAAQSGQSSAADAAKSTTDSQSADSTAQQASSGSSSASTTVSQASLSSGSTTASVASEGASESQAPVPPPVPHSVAGNVILVVELKDQELSQTIYFTKEGAYYKRAATNYTDTSADWPDDWDSNSDSSVITQLQNDINFKVEKGNLMSQINLEAGQALFQSDKLMLDAKSIVFGKDSKAFIPGAYITELNADKITTGTLDAANLKVKNFKADNISGGTLSGVEVKSANSLGQKFDITNATISWENGNGAHGIIGQTKTQDQTGSVNYNDLAILSDSRIIIGPGQISKNDADKGLLVTNSKFPKLIINKAYGFGADGKWEDNPAFNLQTLTGGSLKIWDGLYGGGSDMDSKFTVKIDTMNSVQIHLGVNPVTGATASSDGNEFAIQKDNYFTASFGKDNGFSLFAPRGGFVLHGNTFFSVEDPSAQSKISNLIVNNLHVLSWLGVDHSKNSVVQTSQGTVAINAYETAGYYFGDIGEDTTGETGKRWVSIEYLFGQVVNTAVPYQVFVTPYGDAKVWVSQRLANRFLVESDQPNIDFAYEIKAKRKGFEDVRLKNVDNLITKTGAEISPVDNQEEDAKNGEARN